MKLWPVALAATIILLLAISFIIITASTTCIGCATRNWDSGCMFFSSKPITDINTQAKITSDDIRGWLPKTKIKIPDYDTIEEAYETQNLLKCEELKKEECRNVCYYALAQYYPEACEKIEPFYCAGSPCQQDDNIVGMCYSRLYHLTGDEKHCFDMAQQNAATDYVIDCFEKANYSQEFACQQLSYYLNMWNCYTQKTGTVLPVTEQLCAKLSDPSNPAAKENQERCYRDLAKQTNNIEYCIVEREVNILGYPYCITEVAIQLNDSSLCDEIDPEYFVCVNQHGAYCKGYNATETRPEHRATRDMCREWVQKGEID